MSTTTKVNVDLYLIETQVPLELGKKQVKMEASPPAVPPALYYNLSREYKDIEVVDPVRLVSDFASRGDWRGGGEIDVLRSSAVALNTDLFNPATGIAHTPGGARRGRIRTCGIACHRVDLRRVGIKYFLA